MALSFISPRAENTVEWVSEWVRHIEKGNDKEMRRLIMGENLWDPNGNKFNVIHFPLWFVHGLLQKIYFFRRKKSSGLRVEGNAHTRLHGSEAAQSQHSLRFLFSVISPTACRRRLFAPPIIIHMINISLFSCHSHLFHCGVIMMLTDSCELRKQH